MIAALRALLVSRGTLAAYEACATLAAVDLQVWLSQACLAARHTKDCTTQPMTDAQQTATAAGFLKTIAVDGTRPHCERLGVPMPNIAL